MRQLLAFLKGQNTHLAFWVGVIGGSLFGLLLIGAHLGIEDWVRLHADGAAPFINAIVEGGEIVALWCWFPALLGAAIGRPQWFKQEGTLLKAKDVEK